MQQTERACFTTVQEGAETDRFELTEGREGRRPSNLQDSSSDEAGVGNSACVILGLFSKKSSWRPRELLTILTEMLECLEGVVVADVTHSGVPLEDTLYK